MKTEGTYKPGGSRYTISGMTAQEFVDLRSGLIQSAASNMLFAYQWPSGYTKRKRNSAFALLKKVLLKGEAKDELSRRALAVFKQQVRAEKTGGHFRGGKWRNGVYSKRV